MVMRNIDKKGALSVILNVFSTVTLLYNHLIMNAINSIKCQMLLNALQGQESHRFGNTGMRPGSQPQVHIQAFDIVNEEIIDLLSTDGNRKPQVAESAERGSHVAVGNNTYSGILFNAEFSVYNKRMICLVKYYAIIGCVDYG